jgi:N-acetylmuramoyl-L-alanine amidase
MRRLLILTLLAASVSPAFGAEIVLVYPRNDSLGAVFEYDATLDSTFLLGHVLPPRGELTINGHTVALTSDGAFLAWLPIRRHPEPEEWLLRFQAVGGDSATLRFPYAFGRTAKSVDTSAAPFSPRVVRIEATNAQIRTVPDGSYFVFPELGCRMLATDQRQGFFTVRLGDGLQAAVDERSVAVEQDSQLPPAMLRDGYCRSRNAHSECVLGLDRTVPCFAELVDGDRSLQVTLFDTKAALNRLRYELGDPLLREIAWTQRPEGVVLRITGKRAFSRGYSIAYVNDSLRVVLRGASSTGKGLKGKTIVLDPGHGGNATGAVGALGTKEKDVVLRLALLLEKELKRSGANVLLTRRGDDDLGLYERIDLARQAQADLLLSLHANALPDGENPLTRNGSATYYYQLHSRAAAEVIHRHLLKAAALRDDGLWYGNLALARPTECPAVLVEVAYLIYPPEERLLSSDDFFRKLAKGLARGIREYFEIP